MIIGNGSIASMLNDRDGVLFFASGVPDSSCTAHKPFGREYTLLQSHLGTDKMFVYFSTISVFTTNSVYTMHKLFFEDVIKAKAKNYTIIRLGNVYGDTNKHTFQNAIKARREAGQPVYVRDEYKYMITKDQINLITDNLPLTGKHEICIFGEMKKVKDLI